MSLWLTLNRFHTLFWLTVDFEQVNVGWAQSSFTCSKLTIKTLEQGVKYVQSVFIVNFEYISHLVLIVFLLLNLIISLAAQLSGTKMFAKLKWINFFGMRNYQSNNVVTFHLVLQNIR